MQYLLMLYSDEVTFTKMTKAQQEEAVGAFTAYTEALRKSGAYVGSNRLASISTATTVQVRNGKTQVLDGPFAETKEKIGGYYLIDVPDLDAAISWAARCPGASFGTIEVRPLFVPG